MRERCIGVLRLQPKLSSSVTNYSLRSKDVCWKCSKVLTSSSKFFCEHCTTILPLTDIDYFDVLDVNNSFEVSTEALQKSFKETQKLLHPDKFTLKTNKEKELSEEISSLINISYSTLLNPLQRGIYMLKLKGISIEEDTQMDDPEFLMEVMELNEQIAAADGNEPLVEIRSKIKDECSKLIKELSDAFKAERSHDAKTLLIRLRYFNNMSEKLRHLIPPS